MNVENHKHAFALIFVAGLTLSLPAQSQESSIDPQTYVSEGQDRSNYSISPEEDDWSAEEVAMVICRYSHQRDGNTGRCDHWCDPARTPLAASFPDRQDYVITDEECLEFGESLVFWGAVYPDVGVEGAMTIAFREANFQLYAFGRGDECGVFQQKTHYVRPDDVRYAMGCDEDESGQGVRNGCDFDDRVRICQWLHASIDNQVYSFFQRANGYAERYGDAWPGWYHSSGSMRDPLCSNGENYLANFRAQLPNIRATLRWARNEIASLDTEESGI